MSFRDYGDDERGTPWLFTPDGRAFVAERSAGLRAAILESSGPLYHWLGADAEWVHGEPQ